MKVFLAEIAPIGEVKRLRCDNGTEYTSAEFKNLLKENKIKQEFSSPHSPHQNGTVERAWRTLFGMTRCMLIPTNLPESLWPYALKAAAYVRNRCYNPRLQKTPYEAYTGKKPNLSHMQVFGSSCFAYKQEKSKLDSRCEKGIFVGYCPVSPAYLVYFPEQNLIKRVRCVKFTDEMSKIEEEEEVISRREEQPVEERNREDHSETMGEEDRDVDHETQAETDKLDENKRSSREKKKPKHLACLCL